MMRTELGIEIVLAVVQDMKEDGTLAQLIIELKKKGYLDVKEDPPRSSIADQEWDSFKINNGSYSVIKIGAMGYPEIATEIPTRKLADAIAALPDLVKAAKAILNQIQDMSNDEPLVTVHLQYALEKAGEKVDL